MTIRQNGIEVDRFAVGHEEIHPEDVGPASAHVVDLSDEIVDRPVPGGEEPQPSGIVEGRDQLRCGDAARHRRGDNGPAQVPEIDHDPPALTVRAPVG